jgi:NADPH:quinone reductase-like Zn-dependent oxidoreductase/NAD(P)-dependent dehydrogenase (short-subunit alcohol dehydrogenase family)
MILRPGGDRVRCRLLVHGASAANRETRSADLLVSTLDGAPVAVARGIHLKRARGLGAGARHTFDFTWRRDDRVAESTSQTGRLLIVGHDGRGRRELSAQLTARGVTADAVDVNRLAAPPGHYNRVLFLADASTPQSLHDPMRLMEGACRQFFEGAQSILRAGAAPMREIWIVTHDVQPVVDGDTCERFPQSALWGLARTLALEYPSIRWVRVDLDATAASLASLVEALRSAPVDDEMAFRSGARYVPRLTPRSRAAAAGPERLVVTERGSIANLQRVPITPQALAGSEVKVEVEASTLNFRDVLNVLGAYPGEPGPLGLEFCGRVSAVGSAVQRFAVGDHVLGIAWGSLSDVVIVPEALIAAVPAGLTAEAAVTLPNAFATAFHCLVEVARLQAGERILIHAATGGVGSMAVQIAQHLGAEIFATAGSEEKRQWLRDAGVSHVFDSRSLSFAKEIRALTAGGGVDVVLNSLAGDFVCESIQLLAEHGRFVEIGKATILPAEAVAALGRQIEYTAVDLGTFVDHVQQRIADLLKHMHEWLERGAIRPLPHHVFPFSQATAAFRFMERARHIGKIVLRHRAASQSGVAGTWVLTGGLGALGLSVAEWLASRGAKRIVLLARHAPTAAASHRIDLLRQRGAVVEIAAIDLSTTASLPKLEQIVAQSAPAVSGIVHLAGVLDDGVFELQTWARVTGVLAPKVVGAWLVQKVAARFEVPQVILFSSVGAVLGAPGQSGYAAANAFMDGMAAYCADRGRPTVSVAWGPWADGGMAARLDATNTRRGLDLLRPMTAAECFDALETVVASGVTLAVVMAADRRPATTPAGRRIAALLGNDGAPAPPPAAASIPALWLSGGPRTVVRKAIVEHLRDEIRLALGLASDYFIDEQQPLMKLGLDSLMLLEVRNRLAVSFGRPMSATLLFDRPTIGALADFLAPVPSTLEAVAPDELFEQVAAMSDEEAERLLTEELSGGEAK